MPTSAHGTMRASSPTVMRERSGKDRVSGLRYEKEDTFAVAGGGGQRSAKLAPLGLVRNVWEGGV